MARVPVTMGALLLMAMCVGCSGSDSYDSLVNDTVNNMGEASKHIVDLRRRVDDAVKKANASGSTKLDFTEANKAIEGLKKVGQDAQKIKSRVEAVHDKITETERAASAETHSKAIQDRVSQLNKEHVELTAALKAADAIDSRETEKLRARLREAENPFEAISRRN